MLGSLISAGSSIIGSIFGSKERAKDRALQQRAMTHGIRDRVADAKAAGIHPLAALGASTTGYTPVGSGGIEAGIASAGDAISKGMEQRLGERQAESSIKVNEAQAELLRAQTQTEIQNARHRAIGVAGVKNKMTAPEAIQTPLGAFTPTTGTPSSNIEDEVGGITAETVGLMRVLGGLANQFGSFVDRSIAERNADWKRYQREKLKRGGHSTHYKRSN